MTDTDRPSWSRQAVVAVAGAVALMLGLVAVAPATQATTPDQDAGDGADATAGEAETAQSADSPIGFERHAGTTRYQTAAEIATARFSAPQTDVVLATGEDYADALAGAALEGSLEAPVLLVPSNLVNGAVPTAITDAINELGATTATLLGGENAISPDVETHIEETTTVATSNRVQGSTRFETAEEIANEVSASPVPTELQDLLNFEDGNVAFVATGLEFADALSAGAGAYEGPHPILLTGPDELHPAAQRGIEASNADSVIILGGTDAVGADVETTLNNEGYETQRLAGADRWETATEVADAFADGLGYGVADVGLATGFEFADALASAPYLGEVPAPVVLTPGNNVNDQPLSWFEERACDIETMHVFGGQVAVQDAVAEGYAEASCPADGADGLLSGEFAEELQADDTGQNQDFTFTVEDEPIGAGDVVTIDLSAAEVENADYSGAAVDGASGAGTAAFDPATTTITYTGAAGEDAVGDEVTVTLEEVAAGAAQQGLEVTFERDSYANTVTFPIEG